MTGLNVEQCSVLQVADDDTLFGQYAAALARAGVEATQLDRARDTARRTWRRQSGATARQRPEALGTGDVGGLGPLDREVPDWGRNERRAMVALTWPDPLAQPVFIDPQARSDSSLPTLADRTYADVVFQTQRALKAVLVSLRRAGHDIGDLKQLADLHLDRAAVTGGTTRAHISDLLFGTTWHWHSGYLLTWEDLLPLIEGLALSFAEDWVAHGSWLCDHGLLGRRLTALPDLTARLRDATSLVGLALSDDHTPGVGAEDPEVVHDRITATGRLLPPAPGAKYRALFDLLDTTTTSTRYLDRRELDELTKAAEVPSPRPVRGARGAGGLPGKADLAAWWSSPWSPDQPDWSLVEDLSSAGQPSYPPLRRAASTCRLDDSASDKPQTRAWLTAGYTTTAHVDRGTKKLTGVTFHPVLGRESWAPHRASLRAGTYTRYVPLPLPQGYPPSGMA